jgi:murein L,D-transpeptidase YafK
VLKEGGEVEVWAAGRDGAYIRFQTYRLCGAAQALGPRRRIGDQQAPEGFYLLTPGRMDASARAYLSLAVEELWALASAAFRAGQRAIPVHIFPFALTSRALRRPAPETLTRFWAELEPAWRLFEAERKPPATGVRGGRYVVSSAG